MSSSDWVPSLWVNTFDELLDYDNELDYGDAWTFNFNYSQTNTITSEERKRGWKLFNPCGFGGFRCGTCRNTWSSARVTMLFRYRLQRGRGTVVMRPFGQACRHCDEDFYLPGFRENEVKRVLLRLLSKIRKNCYGEEDDNCDCSQSYNKKTKPHETELCEACAQGICCQNEGQN